MEGSFHHKTLRAQAAYLAIPTLLKVRAFRSGETSGVLEDLEEQVLQTEQNKQRLGSGL